MADDQTSGSQAPFIPTDPAAPPIPPDPWRLFGSREFFRLWLAQAISSLGDWVGLLAILAIAARVSHNSGAAVSLVMTTRVVPGFFLAPLGGVIIDRFDRRRVMVACDVGRAALLVLLPFTSGLLGLVLVSLGLEVLTLLWGPAQAASVPNLVNAEQLASANSLSLVASFGTFPVASLAFTLLAGLASVLGTFNIVHAFRVDQESLALVVDAATFLVSAVIVWRLPLRRTRPTSGRRFDWTETFRDVREGMRFIRHEALVRGVIVGLGVGIIGCGAMIPLGPVFAKEVLGGGASAFGFLMASFGFGAAFGVITLLWLQRRLPRATVFSWAILGVGFCLILAASFSALAPAALVVVFLGACAGTSYVTGFTVLQESVSDELRGRTFATLYTVVRLCLLVALTLSPLWADFWAWCVRMVWSDNSIGIRSYQYHLPGVRITLWVGGLITGAAGWYAWRAIHRASSACGQRRSRSGALTCSS